MVPIIGWGQLIRIEGYVIALETSAGRVLASSHEGDREKMLKNVVPDPKGIERARQIAAMTENDGDRGKIPEPLAFMRAKSSGSTPRFLLGNLGA